LGAVRYRGGRHPQTGIDAWCLLLTAASNLAGATDKGATIVATILIAVNADLRFYAFEVLRGKALYGDSRVKRFS